MFLAQSQGNGGIQQQKTDPWELQQRCWRTSQPRNVGFQRPKSTTWYKRQPSPPNMMNKTVGVAAAVAVAPLLPQILCCNPTWIRLSLRVQSPVWMFKRFSPGITRFVMVHPYTQTIQIWSVSCLITLILYYLLLRLNSVVYLSKLALFYSFF